jgi:hypothetical protein
MFLERRACSIEELLVRVLEPSFKNQAGSFKKEFLFIKHPFQ